MHETVSGFAIPVIKGGFPHSEIPGSKLIRSSPRLNAAYHVLHRLCMPRHPPNALKTLDRSHCRWPFLAEQSRQFLIHTLGRVADQERPVSRDLCGCARSGGTSMVIPGWRPDIAFRWNRNPNKSSLHDVDRTGTEAARRPCKLFSYGGNCLPFIANRCRPSDRIGRRRQAPRPRSDGEAICVSEMNGGAGRDRTDDLLNANQALSQLSYGPEQHFLAIERYSHCAASMGRRRAGGPG